MAELGSLGRIRRSPAMRDRIHDRLRSAILSGEICAGTAIIEAEVAERLGASRTPVREALRKLEAEGLLEPRGGRGTVVRSIAPGEMNCIFEMREALEPLAARRAARRIAPEEVAALRKMIERMRDAIDDPAAMEKCDTAFHDAILRIADGDRLKRMLLDLREELIAWRSLSLADPARRAQTVREHERIAEALAAGDEARAEACSLDHVRNAKTAVLAHGR
jgi:DNA-binding GntR family transcriptional regulator